VGDDLPPGVRGRLSGWSGRFGRRPCPGGSPGDGPPGPTTSRSENPGRGDEDGQHRELGPQGEATYQHRGSQPWARDGQTSRPELAVAAHRPEVAKSAAVRSGTRCRPPRLQDQPNQSSRSPSSTTISILRRVSWSNAVRRATSRAMRRGSPPLRVRARRSKRGHVAVARATGSGTVEDDATGGGGASTCTPRITHLAHSRQVDASTRAGRSCAPSTLEGGRLARREAAPILLPIRRRPALRTH
jgi:hypothetical protein